MTFPVLDRISDYPAHHAAVAPLTSATWFEGQVLDYRDFAAAVDRFASAVVALGLPKGSRIAVLSTPRPEVWIALLGIVRAGQIFVGLNPRHTRHELDHVIGNSEPSVIFSLAQFEGASFEPMIAALAGAHAGIRSTWRLDHGPTVGCLASMDDFLARGDHLAPQVLAGAISAVVPNDPAVIVYTSGSSGKPKGAVLPHKALVYAPHQNATAMALPAPRVICSMPFNHIGCVNSVCATTLIPGGMLAFLERPDIGAMASLIPELRLTSVQHVPTVLAALIKHPAFQSADVSSLQYVGWGGAAMPISVIERFRELRLKMICAYGQTESGGSICRADHTFTNEQLATTVGVPDPNQQVRLVGDDGRPVAEGESGEVRVRHDAQMLGYFNLPEATAAAWDEDGFLRTGDIGVRNPDGTYRLVGRRSEFFKSGGYNVYPREIEICLEQHPAVGVAAVVEVPDPTFQEVGVAFVQTRPGATPPTPQALKAWCSEHLANYKIPKRFVVEQDLPLLAIGKIDKQQLRRRAREA